MKYILILAILISTSAKAQFFGRVLVQQPHRPHVCGSVYLTSPPIYECSICHFEARPDAFDADTSCISREWDYYHKQKMVEFNYQQQKFPLPDNAKTGVMQSLNKVFHGDTLVIEIRAGGFIYWVDDKGNKFKIEIAKP